MKFRARFALIFIATAASDCGASSDPNKTAAESLVDRGTVTVTVNAANVLGTTRTGGGSVYTGFTNYIPADRAATGMLAAIPYRLNRVHFSGEVPDSTFRTENRLASQFPQPSAPPAAWDLKWSDGAVAAARRVRDAGGPDFIMSIHNAPTWMTASGVDGTRPRTEQLYAEYCKRLVLYYNKGSFVDDSGRTVTNPAGPARIRYWEIWNEPEINDFGGGSTPVFTPTQYASLFKTVSAAMRSADPTIMIGGPNTISDVDDTFSYFNAMVSAGAPPDFMTYHQYQAETYMSDATAFATGTKIISRPKTTLPIVISECNSDASDAQQRTGSAFELAFMPLLYKSHIEVGTWRVIRWETYEHNYDLIDATKGTPQRTYWMERAFWESVPEGSTRVECRSSSSDVDCLAVLTEQGKLNLVLINRGVVASTDKNGTGVQHTISVAGVGSRTFAKRVVDHNTSATSGPAVAVGSASGVVIDGYGMAALQEQSGGGETDAGVPPDSGTPDTGTTTTTTVSCSSLTTTSGSLGGAANACSGSPKSLTSSDGVLVTWNAGTERPSAYARYRLPVDASLVKRLQLVIRYRGDDRTEPLWYWHLRNSAGTWVRVGDSSFAGNWVWSSRTIEIANPELYINGSRDVFVRFRTFSNTNSAELDRMVLKVTY